MAKATIVLDVSMHLFKGDGGVAERRGISVGGAVRSANNNKLAHLSNSCVDFGEGLVAIKADGDGGDRSGGGGGGARNGGG